MKNKPVQKWDVVLVNLDPVKGSEMAKTRPCVVLSPNEANTRLNTVLIAPLTSQIKHYPTCVPVTFKGRTSEVCIDQLKAVDKSRIVKNEGKLDAVYQNIVTQLLLEFFRE